jgi:hypothetical protein
MGEKKKQMGAKKTNKRETESADEEHRGIPQIRRPQLGYSKIEQITHCEARTKAALEVTG